MRNLAVMGVSVLCMGIALLVSLSNSQTAGKAYGMDVPEVGVSTTTETVPSTSELVPTPSVAVPSVIPSVEVVTPIYEAPVATTPQEDEKGWDCTLSSNRVCGIPDEAGVIYLVCHDINGMPVRIVSNAHNCI